MGNTLGISVALQALGQAAWSQGDAAQATARLRESLALLRGLGARLGAAECLEGLAAVAAGQGQPAQAGRLLGAAGMLRQAIGAPLPPVDRPGYEAAVAAARAALGEGAFAAAWAAGRAMTLEQVVAEALAPEIGA